MLDIKISSRCMKSLRRDDANGVEPCHGYCSESMMLTRQCLCQRWVHVEYFGYYDISADKWKQFFTDKLKDMECEYFGTQFIFTRGKNEPPAWNFFILLDSINSRCEEVIRSVLCKSSLEDVQRLGDPDIVEFDDAFGELFHCPLICCHEELFSLVKPFLDGKVVSIASNEDLLRSVLEHQKAAADCYYSFFSSSEDGG